MLATQPDFNDQRFYNDLLSLRTEEAVQFIDLTTWVGETVRRSGVGHGYVQIQVLHTTAAIVTNENEPLLLDALMARARSALSTSVAVRPSAPMAREARGLDTLPR